MSAPPDPLPSFFTRFIVPLLSRNATYILVGICILVLDMTTRKYLPFPLLFVVPVAFAGWYCGARLAYSLAVFLPLGRVFEVIIDGATSPIHHVVINNLTRISVLAFIAYLVIRNARQTKELQARVESLVTICAWSRTVKYEGEWISFEQYLLRRFKVNQPRDIPG